MNQNESLHGYQIAELKALLEPFPEFETSYQEPLAPQDIAAMNIVVKRNGIEHRVHIYPAGYNGIPPELADLRAWLGDLFTRSMQE